MDNVEKKEITIDGLVSELMNKSFKAQMLFLANDDDVKEFTDALKIVKDKMQEIKDFHFNSLIDVRLEVIDMFTDHANAVAKANAEYKVKQ